MNEVLSCMRNARNTQQMLKPRAQGNLSINTLLWNAKHFPLQVLNLPESNSPKDCSIRFFVTFVLFVDSEL